MVLARVSRKCGVEPWSVEFSTPLKNYAYTILINFTLLIIPGQKIRALIDFLGTLPCCDKVGFLRGVENSTLHTPLHTSRLCWNTRPGPSLSLRSRRGVVR